MPIDFQLSERLIGYAAAPALTDEKVPICFRELIGPDDATHLQRQLEQLQDSLFSKVPSLPAPALIDHLLVIIRPDLTCTAYVNELEMIAQIKVTRAVEAGAPVYVSDIGDISSIELGVEVPSDCGVVFVRSLRWKRSLFFDFGPLLSDIGPRDYPLAQMLAKQMLQLLEIPSGIPEGSSDLDEEGEGSQTQIERMQSGLDQLKSLLASSCEAESEYQKLLEHHPWMLGGVYAQVMRHRSLDDRNIPDFTALRCYDSCHDIIELKQPFLPLFKKKSGGFSSEFNDSWNQAERYLSFSTQQRSYLLEEKSLRFENPKCILLLGFGLSEAELRQIRKKESFVRSISVFTYDHLLATASHIVSLMRQAHERPLPGPAESWLTRR